MGAYGVANASDNKNYSIFYTPSLKLTGGARNTDKDHVRVNYELNEVMTIEYKLGKTLINEKEYENSKTWNGNPYSTVCIFNVRTSSEGINPNFAAIARIYMVQIFNNGIATRNFIPCYSTTTVTDVDEIEHPAGTIGLYDTVEGEFYTNKGTGTLGYGMEDGTYVAPRNN